MFRLALAALALATVAQAAPPAKKVLLVGIDGCRPDAIASSQAKHLPALIAGGTYSDACDVLGDRAKNADTASGPGWATILTGVWADRHEVVDNDVKKHNLKDCPNLFARVKAARPKAEVAAFVTWGPLHDPILGAADGVRLVVDGDKKGYKEGDKLAADEAVKYLADGDPAVLFVYFGHVDSTGHGYGFHPKAPKYTNAIEEADAHLGRVLDAVEKRPTRKQEDWLVVVVTDHGGKGRGHFPGVKEPEIRTGFLIVSGTAANKEKLKEKTTTADVVPTVLTHLDIPIEAEWKLDGKAVGLSSRDKPKK